LTRPQVGYFEVAIGVVTGYQLAYNERDPHTGNPVAKELKCVKWDQVCS